MDGNRLIAGAFFGHGACCVCNAAGTVATTPVNLDVDPAYGGAFVASYGYPSQTGADQLTAMPWRTVDAIRIRFFRRFSG